MLMVFSLVIVFILIVIVLLKDGKYHKNLYLSQYEKSASIDIISRKRTMKEYSHITDFLNHFRGGGVLYRDNNDENYGPDLVEKLRKDGKKVLYFNVTTEENFYDKFNSIFQNKYWWSIEMPKHFLYDSDLVVILDHYDNMMDNHIFSDRCAYSANIAIVYSSNMNLFKPIFIITNKEYANELLQYNGHTKYYNLYSDRFYKLID